MKKRGRPLKRKGPYLRFPDSVYPVGLLSDFGQIEVVAIRHTPDLPGFGEDPNNPVVYVARAMAGRKPPSDLFYLKHNPNCISHGFRVYIREVVNYG